MKCLIIKKGVYPYISNYNKQELFGFQKTNTINLNGANHLNMQLSLVHLDAILSPKEKINLDASKIASYLKDLIMIKPILIKGVVVIMDKNSDMDLEKYSMVLEIMKNKKNKCVTEQLQNYVNKIDVMNSVNLDKYDDFMKIIDNYGSNTNIPINYGICINNSLPKWLS